MSNLKKPNFDLPAFGRGWVCSQTAQRGTDVRLEDGCLAHVNTPWPGLRFGQYVTVILHRRLRGGKNFVGEIFDAKVLPPLERPDTRPVALIDESNVASAWEGSSDPANWHYGAVTCFSVGTGVEPIYHPFFLADPCARRKAYDLHKPSARAIAAIHARSGWTRRTFDFGLEKQNADIGAFSFLVQNPTAILITGSDKYSSAELLRRFPNINTPEVQRRIHRVTVKGNRVVSGGLLSEVIALPLFAAGR